MDLWYRVNKDFPEYKLHLVPFEDNHEGILSEIELLEKNLIFLLVYVIQRNGFHAAIFCRLALIKMIAVSREHRLAKKPTLI